MFDNKSNTESILSKSSPSKNVKKEVGLTRNRNPKRQRESDLEEQPSRRRWRRTESGPLTPRHRPMEPDSGDL